MTPTSRPHSDSHTPAGTARQQKVLCFVNHYFGNVSTFRGKSTAGDVQTRREIVQAAVARLRALTGTVDVRICGFPEAALVPVDVDLSCIGEPQFIVYESIERMFEEISNYDWFLNIEDDIFVQDSLIANAQAFAVDSELNEVWLPNRMESRADGSLSCVDLEAVPGWTGLERRFQEETLAVARNCHSGLFLLSRQQMRYAATRVSLKRREQFHGGLMASAYANIHAPFLVWRAKSMPLAHYVIHADNWLFSADARREKQSEPKSYTEAPAPALDADPEPDLRSHITRKDAELSSLRGEVEHLVKHLADLTATHESLLRSSSWRLTAPLRSFGTALPWLRKPLRRAARLAWWTVTLQVRRRVTERDPMAHHVVHADKWMHSVEEVGALSQVQEEGSGYGPTVSPIITGTALLGHIDSIAIEGLFCRMTGWAIDALGEPLPLSSIHLGPHVVTDFVVRRHDRPDVTEVHPHTQARAGFDLRFPLLGLPQEALACDAAIIHGRAGEQADVELPQAVWPALKAREAVAQAPVIGDEPWLPEATANRFRELLKTANCYLEYGSGGTTVMAASTGVPVIVTTESDPNWLAAVRHKLNLLNSTTRAELIYVDIGPTGGLGYPISDSGWKEYFNYSIAAWRYCSSHGLAPNVVLIDGRFRVACFLTSLVHAASGTRIIFDDYFDRPHYHIVEQFAPPVARHDRAAEFVTTGVPMAQGTWFEALRFMSDAR